MEFSKQELNFTYQEGKHLSTTLTFKNTQPFNQLYKFKISTLNRFMIKPNMGSVQPGQTVAVEVVIHKEIVANHENERVQMIYGKNLQDTKTTKSMMFPIVVDGLSSNLNLTTMVESKQDRVKELENQVRELKIAPSSQGYKKKSSKLVLKLIIAIIIGLLIGFFGPLRIFKKKIVHRTV